MYRNAKNDPQEAFRFAVAYEEGVNQHKTYEGRNVSKEIKQAPVFAVNERKNSVHKMWLGV